MSIELLIGTKNRGKIRELAVLLEDLPVVLRSASDFETIPEPEETGDTFSANAVLKARYYAAKSGLLALADDSGLEVAALNGRPGVYSARYAGHNATNDQRIAKLLREVDRSNDLTRTARFVCAVAISSPNGDIEFSAEGVCDGFIARNPRGTNGFGYDPVFVPEGFKETFGELSDEIKQKISHRARAVGKIIRFLEGFVARST